jgi:hypothetical protein
MRTLVIVSSLAAAAAGTIELSSGDLSGGSARSLDNVKGKWTQHLSFGGSGGSTLSAEYDRTSNKDWLSEVSLSGALDKLKYEVTTKFAGAADVKLETTTDDGTTLEVEGSVDHMVGSVSSLKATRATKLLDRTCDLELSHDVAESESKIKLSSVLGSGVKALATFATQRGSSRAAYELEYDTTLTEGRTLSASVNPKAGTGEVEFEDSATLNDVTINAKFPLGKSPAVSIKRSFAF